MTTETIRETILDSIEEITGEGQYNPEDSLEKNGLDSLEIAEIEMTLEDELDMDHDSLKHHIKLDMSLDYIVKVVEHRRNAS